jgi:hypothetical protein
VAANHRSVIRVWFVESFLPYQSNRFNCPAYRGYGGIVSVNTQAAFRSINYGIQTGHGTKSDRIM